MDINRLANCYMARWPGMDYTTAFIKARRVIALCNDGTHEGAVKGWITRRNGGAAPEGGDEEEGGEKPPEKEEPAESVPTPEENIAAGRKAIRDVVDSQKDAIGVMYRRSCGGIDIPWGSAGTAANDYEDGFGMAKILKKHSEDIPAIAPTIARGAVYQDPNRDDRVGIIMGRNLVVLQKEKIANSWLLTGFRAKSDEYLDYYRMGELLEGEI